LIDNYTAIECASIIQPRVVEVRYVIENHRPVSSSTIVSFSGEKGINQRILKLLDSYKLLSKNWDEDGAVAPSPFSISSALFLTKTLEKHGQTIFHAAPGPNGEIMLDIRNGKNTKSLEIIFYSDKSVSVLFPEIGKPSQQIFKFEHLPNLLQWLNQK